MSDNALHFDSSGHSHVVQGHDASGHEHADHAHQFSSLPQQLEAGVLGMWTFLMTEIMFFGAIFAGYLAYRIAYDTAFIHASGELYMWIGAINTAVLLTSSLTVAMAVHSAQLGHQKALQIYLILTMILGATFLGVKAVEYYLDWREHLWPVVGSFHPEGEFWQDQTHLRHGMMFFRFYYTFTAIHALHMVIGLGLFAVMLVNAWRGKYTPRHHAVVEIGGLYWHFVDIVWIFLFPLLYLVR